MLNVFTQIFILVVGYGLFHGLILFPVVLSLIGPASFAAPREKTVIFSEELEPQLPAIKTTEAGESDEATELETIQLNNVSTLLFYPS